MSSTHPKGSLFYFLVIAYSTWNLSNCFSLKNSLLLRAILSNPNHSKDEKILFVAVTQPPTIKPQNKSTIVLTKPPSPSPSLDARPNDRPSNGIDNPESTGTDGDLTDDDYYSSRDGGVILYDAGCIYKTPCFMVVLLTLVVLL